MMTLTKIAKLAHVSVSTASKAFSMSKEVNEETRQAIFNIAKEHKCFNKFYKAKYPKLVISVIVPEFSSIFYSATISEIKNKLEKHNCEILVSSTEFSKENMMSLLDYYTKYTSVDGVIIIDAPPVANEYEIPIVYMSNTRSNNNSEIANPIYSPMEKVIDYFLSRGISSIGFIGEKYTKTKSETFKEIMLEKIGILDENIILIGNERFEKGGYEAIESLINKNISLPRALIFAYDYMAIGGIRCLHEHNIKVPDDVAVIGMDNIPETKYLVPSLSSIDCDISGTCRNIVSTLISLIMDESTEENVTIEPKVYFRESTQID